MAGFKAEIDLVRSRADFFLIEAQRFCGATPYTEQQFAMSPEVAEQTAEAYYLVSEAYKARRQMDGKRTQPTKIAAITTMVMVTINPLRPARPPEVPNQISVYANPLFALRLGCSIVRHPIHKSGWERIQRFCDGLRRDHLSCLDGFIESSRIGGRALGDNTNIDLSLVELSRIEQRISYFEVLQDMKIFIETGKDPHDDA